MLQLSTVVWGFNILVSTLRGCSGQRGIGLHQILVEERDSIFRLCEEELPSVVAVCASSCLKLPVCLVPKSGRISPKNVLQ